MATRGSSTQLLFDEQSFNKLLGLLDKIENKLTDVQKTTEKLQKSSTKIEFKFAGLDSLTGFLDGINKRKVDQFLEVIDGFKKLSDLSGKAGQFKDFLDGISSINAANLVPLTAALKGISGALNPNEINNLDKLSKGLEKVAKTFANFGSNTISTSFIPDIVGAIKSLEGLGKDEVLDAAIKNFGRFSTALKKFVDSLGDIDTGLNKNNTALELGKFFGELQIVFRVLATLSNVIGGQSEIKQLSLVFERLGIGISGLTRNIDKIDLKSTIKLSAFMTAIAAVINIAGRLSGDAKKSTALAAVFEGISSLLKAAFTGFNIKNVTLSKDTLKNLGDRVDFIISVVRSVRSIKIKDAEGVSSVITAVTGLFTALNEVDGNNEGSGLNESTIKIFKEFIASLGDLNKIRISNNIATALGGIGKIFENFDKSGEISKSSENFGTGLSNSVALGFIKGTLAVAVGKFVLRLFTDLNPVALTAKFVGGVVTAFVSLDTKIRDILKGIVDKAKNFGSEITTIGQNLVQNFGVGALTSSSGFQIATEFDDLAQKSKVAGDLTAEQQKQILALADAIGIKYPLSANDALKAIINLQKAGVQAIPDIKAVIEPIADLASLSDDGSIENATNVVIQSISSFKELKDGVASNFNNAAIAVDIFSQAADLSTASVTSLGQGVANVGPLAAQFGLSLQDTVATLALFEDRGIRGAEAGTQLKSVLTNMARPTDAVKDELKKLNISLTDNKGNFKDLNTIFNEFNHAFNDTTKVTRSYTNLSKDQKAQLDQATKAYAAAQRQIFAYNNGLTTGALDQKDANKKLKEYQQVADNAQKAIAKLTGSQKDAKTITVELTRSAQQNFESLNKVFGTFGQQGAAILIGAGDDAIKNFISQMGRLPTAAERAVQLLDTFKGSVEQLSGSGETLIKDFFLPLLDTIFKPLVDGLTAITNALININPEILATISTAVAFGSILASVVGTIAIAVGFFVSFGASVLGFVTAFLSVGGVLGIIGSLVGAVSALVFGIASFVAVVLPVGAILGGLAAGFRTLLSIFSNDIGNAGQTLKLLEDQIGSIAGAFVGLVQTIGDFINVVFSGDGSNSGLVAIGKSFSNFFVGLSRQIIVFTPKITAITNALAAFIDFFKNGFDFGNLDTFDQLDKLSKNPFIKFLLNKLGLDSSIKGIEKLFTTISDGLHKAQHAFDQISQGIGALFTFANPKQLQVAEANIKQGLGTLAGTALKALSTLFGVDFSTAIAAFDVGDLSKGISDLLTRAINGVKDLLLKNRGTIKDVLTGIFNFFFVPGGFLTIITDFLGLNNVSNFIRGIQDTISKLFSGIVDTIFNVLSGQDIKTALTNAFGDGIKPVIKFVETLGTVVTDVIGLFQDLLAVIFPANNVASQFNLMDVVNGVLSFLTDGLSFLDTNILKPLAQIIRQVDFGSFFNFVSKLFGEFSKFFSSVLNGDFSGALSQVQGLGKKLIGAIQDLLTNAFNVQFSPSEDLLHAVAHTFSAILQTAVNGLANLLGFTDFQGLVDGVLKSVNDFFGSNPQEKFASIGTTVVGAIGKAVIDALSSLSDVLGLDPTAIQANLTTGFQAVIDGINNFFLGDDGKGVFGDIQTIFDKLGQAIKAVLDTFTGGGSGDADVAGKKLFTITDALNGIVTFLSRLAGLVLTGIGDSLSGIADFLDRLAKLSPEQILFMAGALLALAAALLPLLAPGLAAGIADVFGSITTFATNLLGGFAIILILKNLADNLGLLVDVFQKLTTLDIAGAADSIIQFFGNIAAGVTFDLLSLFGIDNINGQTKDDVINTINTIAKAAGDGFTNIGKGLTDFVNNVLIPARDTITNIIGAISTVLGVIASVLGFVLKVAGTLLGAALSLVAAPFILVIKAVQAFIDLPQEQKDRMVKFFVALGIAFALYNAQSIISSVGAIGTFLLTTGAETAVAAIGTLTALPALVSSLAASFVALAAPALTIIGTVAAIGAFLILAKSALDNVDKLFSAVFDIVALLGSLLTLDIDGIFTSLGRIFGDITDFIFSTLTDAVFTVAGFFGIDKILGQTKDDIKNTISEIVQLIQAAFKGMGLVISRFFQRTFDDLSHKIQIAAADLRLAAEDAQARIRTIGKNPADDPFFKAQAVFDPKTFDLTKLSAALVDTTIDQTALRDFAIKNAKLIEDALITQIQTGDNSADGLFKIETGIQFAIQSNNLSDVVDQVFSLTGPEGEKAKETFVASITDALKNGRINSSEASDIIKNIFDEIALGTLDPATAEKLLANLDFSGTGLTPEQIAALKKQIADGLKAAADGAKTDAEGNPVTVDPSKLVTVGGTSGDGTGFGAGQGAAGTGTPTTTIPVPVKPVPVLDTSGTGGKKSSFFDDVKTALDEQAANDNTPIEPTVPVAPIFKNVSKPEDVKKIADQIDGLNKSLTDTQTNFGLFVGLINDNISTLQTFADSTTTQTDQINTAIQSVIDKFTLLYDLIRDRSGEAIGRILSIAAAIGAITLSLLVNIPIISAELTILGIAINLFAVGAVAKFDLLKVSIDKVTSAVSDLSFKVGEAIARIDLLNTKKINPDGGGGGSGADPQSGTKPTDGPHAAGGSIGRGVIPVIEKGPELLFQGDKAFLLSGGNGFIAPLTSNFGNIGAPVSANNSPVGGGGFGGIQITEGDIVLNIQGGSVSPQQIENIRSVIKDELNNRNVSLQDRLRSAGR